MAEPTPAAAPSGSPLKLGTFVGVYTPTVLTILGLMLYLRIGWVVGNAGIVGAIAIVVLANVITLLTALSMSALATNMRVGVGGAYYLISRTLGLEFGGAIGIPLYMSQTLSITLYAYGLGESMGLFGPVLLGEATWESAGPWVIQGIAVLTVVGVTLVAARSTELTLKAQLPVMGLIGLSLLALLLGVDWTTIRADSWGSYGDPDVNGFWGTFAVFFPAVTGVLAGVSLSGDLEDPRRAIPLGALAAAATGFVVYMVVPIALSFAADTTALTENNLIWTQVAILGPVLIMPGLWGAILSSAFGSILGAPRTLQALSFDGLAPKVLGQNDAETGEPVLGLRLSGGIALAAAFLLPDLNAVAEWVTVFFLTAYGALNIVACVEALVGDPGFRPTLRVNWIFSALGGVGCFVAMALINPVACVVAISVEGVIFYALSRRSLQKTWGDVRTGLWLSAARYALLQLRRSRVDPRNWRPHILIFTSRVAENIPMIRLAGEIGRHRGIVTLMELLVGEEVDAGRMAERLEENRRTVRKARLQSFCEVAAVPDLLGGITAVTQANGFAGLQSNTVMLGWPGKEGPGLTRILALVRTLSDLEKSVIVYRSGPTNERAPQPRIVVWWKGREHNGDLMLLVAHLLRGGPSWRGATIWLKSVVPDQQAALRRRQEFEELLPDIRIDAEVEVIVNPEGQEPVRDLIRKGSREADLVLLGLPVPAPGEDASYADLVTDLVEGLPQTLLVHNAGPFRGRLV
jgi:solute carrier family 12 (potassium/chloride transporter), member 4/6